MKRINWDKIKINGFCGEILEEKHLAKESFIISEVYFYTQKISINSVGYLRIFFFGQRKHYYLWWGILLYKKKY